MSSSARSTAFALLSTRGVGVTLSLTAISWTHTMYSPVADIVFAPPFQRELHALSPPPGAYLRGGHRSAPMPKSKQRGLRELGASRRQRGRRRLAA